MNYLGSSESLGNFMKTSRLFRALSKYTRELSLILANFREIQRTFVSSLNLSELPEGSEYFWEAQDTSWKFMELWGSSETFWKVQGISGIFRDSGNVPVVQGTRVKFRILSGVSAYFQKVQCTSNKLGELRRSSENFGEIQETLVNFGKVQRSDCGNTAEFQGFSEKIRQLPISWNYFREVMITFENLMENVRN